MKKIERKLIILTPNNDREIIEKLTFFGWSLIKDYDKETERRVNNKYIVGSYIEKRTYLTFERRIDNPNIEEIKEIENNYQRWQNEKDDYLNNFHKIDTLIINENKTLKSLPTHYDPNEIYASGIVLVFVLFVILCLIAIIIIQIQWLVAIAIFILSYTSYVIILNYTIVPRIKNQSYIDKRNTAYQAKILQCNQKIQQLISEKNILEKKIFQLDDLITSTPARISKLMEGYRL